MDELGNELHVEVMPKEKFIKESLFMLGCIWVYLVGVDLSALLAYGLGNTWGREGVYWRIVASLFVNKVVIAVFVAQVIANLYQSRTMRFYENGIAFDRLLKPSRVVLWRDIQRVKCRDFGRPIFLFAANREKAIILPYYFKERKEAYWLVAKHLSPAVMDSKGARVLRKVSKWK
ncbi:MAG: hypothetical protein WC655_18615 [Candidatus Hydrogenedentales bacterium]|jgi:hypothetical protein